MLTTSGLVIPERAPSPVYHTLQGLSRRPSYQNSFIPLLLSESRYLTCPFYQFQTSMTPGDLAGLQQYRR